MNSLMKSAFEKAEKARQAKRSAPRCKDCKHYQLALGICRKPVGQPVYFNPEQVACLLFGKKEEVI